MHTQHPVLNEKELHDLHAWWRASNYLAAGQLYLLDNPLLREPLKPEHIKRKIVRISSIRISTVSLKNMTWI